MNWLICSFWGGIPFYLYFLVFPKIIGVARRWINPYNMRSEETQLNRLKGGDEHEHANHKSGVSHTNSGSVEREVSQKPR
jgi:hypothetical protein